MKGLSHEKLSVMTHDLGELIKERRRLTHHDLYMVSSNFFLNYHFSFGFFSCVFIESKNLRLLIRTLNTAISWSARQSERYFNPNKFRSGSRLGTSDRKEIPGSRDREATEKSQSTP